MAQGAVLCGWSYVISAPGPVLCSPHSASCHLRLTLCPRAEGLVCNLLTDPAFLWAVCWGVFLCPSRRPQPSFPRQPQRPPSIPVPHGHFIPLTSPQGGRGFCVSSGKLCPLGCCRHGLGGRSMSCLPVPTLLEPQGHESLAQCGGPSASLVLFLPLVVSAAGE